MSAQERARRLVNEAAPITDPDSGEEMVFRLNTQALIDVVATLRMARSVSDECICRSCVMKNARAWIQQPMEALSQDLDAHLDSFLTTGITLDQQQNKLYELFIDMTGVAAQCPTSSMYAAMLDAEIPSVALDITRDSMLALVQCHFHKRKTAPKEYEHPVETLRYLIRVAEMQRSNMEAALDDIEVLLFQLPPSEEVN